MKIALASDHAGFDLKEILTKWLIEKGIKVDDFGTGSDESVDYPDFAVLAASSVAEGKDNLGILICGTGTGMSITANKVKGIRAANCPLPGMAKLAREHNDANVLTLGSRIIDEKTAKQIIEEFLSAKFEGGRHRRRIDKIHDLTGL